MNADTQNNILSLTIEAQQLDLERSRMQLEDQRSTVIEKTDLLLEEVSFIRSHLYPSRHVNSTAYDAACDALEILDPGDPENYDD